MGYEFLFKIGNTAIYLSSSNWAFQRIHECTLSNWALVDAEKLACTVSWQELAKTTFCRSAMPQIITHNCGAGLRGKIDVILNMILVIVVAIMFVVVVIIINVVLMMINYVFAVSMFLLFTLERPLSPSYFADGTQLVVVVVLCSTYHRTSTVRRCCFSVGLRSRLTCLLSIRFSASQWVGKVFFFKTLNLSNLQGFFLALPFWNI